MEVALNQGVLPWFGASGLDSFWGKRRSAESRWAKKRSAESRSAARRGEATAAVRPPDMDCCLSSEDLDGAMPGARHKDGIHAADDKRGSLAHGIGFLQSISRPTWMTRFVQQPEESIPISSGCSPLPFWSTHGLEDEGFEDEHFEGSLDEVAGFFRHRRSIPLDDQEVPLSSLDCQEVPRSSLDCQEESDGEAGRREEGAGRREQGC